MSLQAARRLSAVPVQKLSSLRVRDSITGKRVFPELLQASIITHYKDLSRYKQEELSQLLSKKKNVSVYQKPLVPSPDKLKTYRQSMDTFQELIEESYYDKIKSNKNELATVDFITYRSLPHLYYISNRMFSEIKAFDKDFSPYSMLDMGHNIGASVWAIQKFYGESIDDYVIHEHNKAEYDRTVKLLNNKYKPHIKNVVVKGALSMPRSRANSFDIVTAINYFPYLQEFELRQWFDKIWGRTGEYLVIADIANRYTSQRMAKIRSHFIAKHRKEGHILAPCPHAKVCPMLKKKDLHGCKFAMNNVMIFGPKKLLPEHTILFDHQKVEYSYLILKRGPKKASDTNHARLLKPVTHHDKDNVARKKILEFVTCNSNGTLWRAKTSYNGSPALYKHVFTKKSCDLIDGNWLHHNFAAGSISWESRSIKQQLLDLRVKNQTRINKYQHEAGEEAEELLKDDITSEVDNEFQSESDLQEESLDSEDIFGGDHVESILALDVNDDKL